MAFKPETTDTQPPSEEALLLWAAFVAREIEDDRDAQIFETPGLLEALDEAIAEVAEAKREP